MYMKKTTDAVNALQQMDQSDDNYEVFRKRSNKLSDLCTCLKKTNWKNNIMREAKELFYDKDFLNKLDDNPNLLCFNNYVIDFINRKNIEGSASGTHAFHDTIEAQLSIGGFQDGVDSTNNDVSVINIMGKCGNKSTQGISIQILTNPEFTPFLSKLEKTPFKKSEKFKLFFITY